MKLDHALTVVLVFLTSNPASATTQGETGHQTPKMTSGSASPSLKDGEPFLIARARILRTGWHPTRMHSNEDC